MSRQVCVRASSMKAIAMNGVKGFWDQEREREIERERERHNKSMYVLYGMFHESHGKLALRTS